ncbi:hypothetical protein XH79_31910 [Bradyrhizobium sp. CCBAU 45389]|nr:hypothetical protein [Bradyrhizobium sp. CCBAU 45389]
MRGHVGLASLLEEGVPLGTGGKAQGLIPDLLHPCSKPVLKAQLLLETSSRGHGTLLSMRGRRERKSAFSSPIVARVRAAMTH